MGPVPPVRQSLPIQGSKACPRNCCLAQTGFFDQRWSGYRPGCRWRTHFGFKAQTELSLNIGEVARPRTGFVGDWQEFNQNQGCVSRETRCWLAPRFRTYFPFPMACHGPEISTPSFCIYNPQRHDIALEEQSALRTRLFDR